MAHLIENMFSVGETPWHRLGTVLDNPPTIEEALELAGMDWEVNKVPTLYEAKLPIKGLPTVGYQQTGHFVTVRSDTGKPIGNVGKKYEVLQNRDAFEPFSAITEFGYTLETAGVIDGGKKVWILAKTPKEYLVGDDKILDYILMYTSHDGSSGNCFRDVEIRVVCNNTLTWALNGKKTAEYKLRHTSSIKERVTELTSALKSRQGNIQKAVDDMNRFVDMKMSDEMVDLYFETVMPVLKNRHKESIPEMKIWVRNKTKPVYDKLIQLYKNGQGNRGETLWDAYNAITEYHDHHKKHHTDWVKSTQFGQSSIDKRRAFAIAKKMSQNISTIVGGA